MDGRKNELKFQLGSDLNHVRAVCAVVWSAVLRSSVPYDEARDLTHLLKYLYEILEGEIDDIEQVEK